MRNKPHYSQQNKEYFWRTLDRYRKALETGEGIIETSLAIHSALANVPKSYKRYVTKTFSTTKRESSPCEQMSTP